MNFGGDHQRRPRRSMCHSQIYSASREGAWRWSVCFIVPTIYCKTQQRARKDKDMFSLRYLSFVSLYFDFWTILVHRSFDDSSYFVLVNIQ